MKIVDENVRVSASDLANFLACRHLTRLDLLKAHGQLKPAWAFDVGFQALVRRGEEHERLILGRFRDDGLEIAEISPGATTDTRRGAVATADAIARGVDVIYQAVLRRPATSSEPELLGRPDFLVRAGLLPTPDGRVKLDGAHYEVVDAKLARSAKARAVLQSAFYSHLLTEVQGTEPRWMHLALGSGDFASLKVSDYAAYERQMRRLLHQFVAADSVENPPVDTYPEPVEHCAICRWSVDCATRRRDDDDLSLVAGITKRQRRALKAAGLSTRRGFAAVDPLPELGRLNRQSLVDVQAQARLQVESEDEGEIVYELLEPERDGDGQLVANRGFLALPAPVVGDLFFDIEGARYYSEDGTEFGLQYLFGLVDTADLDAGGTPRYKQIWSFDRSSEKRAFEELIDFITERRKANPALHVYHYNHYEPTSVDHLTELHETRQEAVGRLMGRFATHEDAVDDLFRLGVFVDLYRVVKQGLRAGVESYSLKSVERLCGFPRQVDLGEATKHLIALEAALDEGTARVDGENRRVVAGYNEDDCRATVVLRDWLEDRRSEMVAALGEDLPRPVMVEEAHATTDPEVARIKMELLAGLPEDPSSWSEAERAKALLADLLEWHRREAKPGWWRYFYMRNLSDEELIGEPDAIGGLQGGEFVEDVKKSVVLRFSFPPQEHGFSAGDKAQDPVSGRSWQVWSLDDEKGLIELKIGRASTEPPPAALVEEGPSWDTRTLTARLRELGERVALDGPTGGDAATALLMRRRPNGDSAAVGPLRRDHEGAGEAAVRFARGLSDSYLPIQGPPGTGKTYTGAEQILALIAGGRCVGITGPSHAVIHNIVGAVLRRADEQGTVLRVGQRADEDNPFLHDRAKPMSYAALADGLRQGELDIGAGTAWLWAREQSAGSVDTLFVDEAGQMSLANVLAIAGAGRNLVLLGDPQQLAQPSQAVHPPGAGVSALEHILAGGATMPANAGLLLDRTWRMHPAICTYTSEVFYDSRLGWVSGLDRQAVAEGRGLQGSGIRIVEVPHEGNTNDSPEEAGQVARVVRDLLGGKWRDKEGKVLPITSPDIMVVTPYNAQVREIGEALALARAGGVRVGTVDKFQGREAAVVIYSMATSSAEEAPRGMEFLYDPHRLNVATSRARAMAIIVANPHLVRVFCRTPRQMVLANALCRAWEMH
jgi:uncharacterized protein